MQFNQINNNQGDVNTVFIGGDVRQKGEGMSYVKKTVEEAQAFFHEFVKMAADFAGMEVPPYELDPVQVTCRRPHVFIDYRGHKIKLCPYIRVQGDEKFWSWEPFDGGSGQAFRGDAVDASYAEGEYLHDCPDCECCVPQYTSGTFHGIEEFRAWLKEVEAKA